VNHEWNGRQRKQTRAVETRSHSKSRPTSQHMGQIHTDIIAVVQKIILSLVTIFSANVCIVIFIIIISN